MNEGPLPMWNGPLLMLAVAVSDGAIEGGHTMEDLLHPEILGSRDRVRVAWKESW